jgi:hypothetical protein
MSIDQKEKECLFKKHGGRLECFDPSQTFLSDLISAARQWCAQTVSAESERSGRRICLDLFDNATVNAHATNYTHDYIALNREAVDTLLGSFGQLLPHPSSLQSSGNPAPDLEDLAVGPNFFSLGSERTLCHIVPRCSQRQHFTVNLTSMALYFLVMHEVGHLRNGHVDLLMNLGVCELPEITSRNVFAGERPLRQTLEIDADASAAAKSMGFAIERVAIQGKTDSPGAGALRDAHSDHERALHTLALAVYVLFRVFEPSDHPPDSIGTATHPPS